MKNLVKGTDSRGLRNRKGFPSFLVSPSGYSQGSLGWRLCRSLSTKDLHYPYLESLRVQNSLEVFSWGGGWNVVYEKLKK